MSNPSLSSRETAKRSNAIAGRNSRVLSAKPSEGVLGRRDDTVMIRVYARHFRGISVEQSPLEESPMQARIAALAVRCDALLPPAGETLAAAATYPASL